MSAKFNVLFTAAPNVVLWPDGLTQADTTVAPLGLYSLSALVKHAGFGCSILDPVEFWRDVRTPEDLEAFAGGHAVACVSANSATWATAMALIQRLSELRPRPIIIVGGAHGTFCDEHVMRSTKVDIVVRGEGEGVLPTLLRRLAAKGPLDDIDGLAFRRKGNIVRTKDQTALTPAQLSETPLPLWQRLPPGQYHLLPVELSRAGQPGVTDPSCPNHPPCNVSTACAVARLQHAVRHLSLVRSRTLLFTDESLTDDVERMCMVAAILLDTHPAVGVALRANPSDLSSETVLAALSHLKTELVDLCADRSSADELVTAARGLHAAGVSTQVKYSFNVGGSEQTASDVMRTMAFSMSLASRYGNRLQLKWQSQFPGSSGYLDLQRRGLAPAARVFDDWPTGSAVAQTAPGIDANALRQIDDFAAILRQSFPWVSTTGNLFRPWIRHAHLAADRAAPVLRDPDRRSRSMGTLNFANLPPRLPLVLQRRVSS